MQDILAVPLRNSVKNSQYNSDKASSIDRAFTIKPKQLSSSSSSGSTSSDSSSTNITSDDFMTLLVSELQNQDPTAPTDPNSYIDQLVQVNSLQQLISINQGITTLTGAVPAQSSIASGANLDANSSDISSSLQQK